METLTLLAALADLDRLPPLSRTSFRCPEAAGKDTGRLADAQEQRACLRAPGQTMGQTPGRKHRLGLGAHVKSAATREPCARRRFMDGVHPF
ncbi:hypothetical protein [Leisingera sp. M523]|uniref:hypothetical protein n=1 Tax=Leisingera sp. M523 TaxID=2867013 RepID=UPI0021A6C508|nr:hypothetical protein [Leisingera sp. M523]UWQ29368.1 hypothetical protein K3557_02040 [Leisingera sp. M523]